MSSFSGLFFSRAEPAAVFLLIVAYIWRLRFIYPKAWIAILAVVVLSHLVRRETPPSLGFRQANLALCLRSYGPALMGIAFVLLAGGLALHTVREVNPELAAGGFALYCVWGLFQQYILNGYFVNRLRSPWLAAILFAAVHAPNWFLMLVTAAGGFVCARIYLRWRNLWFLGLAHAVVGFLLYLVVPDSVSHHLYVGPKYFSR